MLRKITKTACFAAIASIAFTGAQAQTTTNRVEAKTDWSVFQENIGGTKQCWVVTAPTKVVNMRNGKKVEATRSEILLFVTYVPASGIKGEVSFGRHQNAVFDGNGAAIVEKVNLAHGQCTRGGGAHAFNTNDV